jgi:hypothetical protein
VSSSCLYQDLRKMKLGTIPNFDNRIRMFEEQ